MLAYYFKFHAFQDPFLSMLFYVNFVWIFLVSWIKPYNISRTSSFLNVLRSAVYMQVLHMLFVFGYYVFQQEHRYSRELLLEMYLSLFALLFVFKTLFYVGLKAARKRGWNYRNVVIVTQEEDSEDLKDYLLAHTEYGYKIQGTFDNRKLDDVNYLNELKAYCLSKGIHELFFSLSGGHYNALNELMNFAEDNLIKVGLIADFKGVGYRELALEKFGMTPVLKVHTTPLDSWNNQLIKRAFDVLFSLLVIVLLLSWLVPLLALLIKLDSKGPVFFKQLRTGRDNQSFWCLKLRTMVINAESDIMQATKNDPRITRLGKFLRKTSLDELPQFFNVLAGSMSVVGPRPHMLKHTQDFSAELDKFMTRHRIKPGITGLAQSMGYRGETVEFEQKKNRVKLDLFYMKNWSLALDIKIIVKTFLTLNA